VGCSTMLLLLLLLDNSSSIVSKDNITFILRVKQSSWTGGCSPRRLILPMHHSKRWELFGQWHGITSQKTCIFYMYLSLGINCEAIYCVILLLIQKVINLSISVHSTSSPKWNGMSWNASSSRWVHKMVLHSIEDTMNIITVDTWYAILIHIPAHAV